MPFQLSAEASHPHHRRVPSGVLQHKGALWVDSYLHSYMFSYSLKKVSCAVFQESQHLCHWLGMILCHLSQVPSRLHLFCATSQDLSVQDANVATIECIMHWSKNTFFCTDNGFKWCGRDCLVFPQAHLLFFRTLSRPVSSEFRWGQVTKSWQTKL